MVRKPTMIVLLIALTLAPMALLADEAQTFTGNNTNGPLWQRPIVAGPEILEAPIHLQSQRFQLLVDSACYIVGAQEFDGYLHLYSGSFDPSQPLANLLFGNDDSGLGTGSSRLPGDPSVPSIALTAGTYVLVTSGFDADEQGSFQNSIHCNGPVQPIHGSCSVQYGSGIERDQEICLLDRFLVVTQWSNSSDMGTATPVRTGSKDSGLFWFFSDNNWEVMVKVLDGCAINGHYWVFIGALTNQEYTVSVADAKTLQVNDYSNPLGTRSPAFTDTTAFPCD